MWIEFQPNFIFKAIAPDRRILGGDDAEIQDHPHQASLRTIVGFHFCGATIITGHFVLTAAHCVAGRQTSTFVIIPGITQLSVGGIRHPVRRIVVYPNYNSITMQNDIAIVETGDVMVFSNLVNPALLSTDFVEGGVTASFTGWGLTSVSILIKYTHLSSYNDYKNLFLVLVPSWSKSGYATKNLSRYHYEWWMPWTTNR